VGSQARLMSQALRKLVQNASKCNCTVIFINQIRYKVPLRPNPNRRHEKPSTHGTGFRRVQYD
jgi:RecA/RadA recombinase